jgi:hypothetical protein
MSVDADTAQALVLIAALREQIAEMATRLRAVRSQVGSERTRRDIALRQEANELLRDISKAQFLVNRLNTRFPDTRGVEAPKAVTTS